MTESLVPGPREFAAYAHKIRYFFLAVALLMAFSFLIGVAIAATMPAETNAIMKLLASQFATYKDLPSFDLMVSLFLHNALICAVMALLGLALGAITLLIIFDNGLAIGLVSAAAVGRTGFLLTLAAFLPHGVIELPAMALSAAIGLYLGYCVLISLFGRKVDVAREALVSARIFVVWVLPILLVAAFVESYVTTALVYFLTR